MCTRIIHDSVLIKFIILQVHRCKYEHSYSNMLSQTLQTTPNVIRNA